MAPQHTPAPDEPVSPRELRRRERLETRRLTILAAADKLFAEFGYEGTSLEKIAAASGYSVGGIYNSFHSKEELYTAVLGEHADALADRLTADADSSVPGLDKILAMASTAVRTLREFPDHARLDARYATSDNAAARHNYKLVMSAYAAAISEGQRDGTIRAGEPRHLAQYVGGLVLAQTQIERRLDDGERERTLADFLDILRRAITAV